MALLVVGFVSWFVARLLSPASLPPEFSRASAQAAVERARGADALRWAPDLLRQAEGTLEASLIEYRRQQLRLMGLRDFTRVRGELRRAEEQADHAAREAATRREAARQAADEALQRAGPAVRDAEAAAMVARLPPQTRRSLQRSRLAWAQAVVRYRDGDYTSAAELADRAGETASDFLDHVAGKAARYLDAEQRAQWAGWVRDTIEGSRRRNESAIIVFKEDNLVRLYRGGKVARSYPADMGRNNLGRKLHAGDAATPEGRYRIETKKGPGQTIYHKALLLDYPNEEDRRRFRNARAAGALPRGAGPGSMIEIHGHGGRGVDWTRGCVALSNSDMDDLFDRVGPGTPVTIVGGHGGNGTFSKLARNGARGASAQVGAGD